MKTADRTQIGAAEDQRLAELVEEIAERLQSGATDDVDEYIARYPEYADRLRDWVNAMTAMADLGHSLIGDSGQSLGESDERGPTTGVLGDFRILREIGRGGMGVVYEAEQISLGRRVALKVLPFAAMLDQQQLARFKNEARAAATLDHPNIVAIHSVGTERGVHYYAMQLVEGRSLAQVIAELQESRGDDADPAAHVVLDVTAILAADAGHAPRHPEPAAAATGETRRDLQAAISTIPAFDSREFYRRVAELGIQAAEALDHAHQNGILHRDVKPANLMVDDNGKLWITDFGLARIEQDAGMTMTGDILGTLRYMSPEQALAKRVVVDHRSDIYSLGVTLYELTALRAAYPATDRQELLRQIAFDEPLKPRQHVRHIPRDLETIVLKAMEKYPSQRYATAHALAEDLRRFLDERTITARRPTLRAVAQRWSRRHRGLLIATAATLLTIALTLAGSIGWIVRDRIARQSAAEATANLALEQAKRLMSQSKWPEALAAATHAVEVLTNGDYRGASSTRAHEVRTDLEMIARLEAIRNHPDLGKSSPVPADEQGAIRFPDMGIKYAQAFADYGIDVDAVEVAQAFAHVRDKTVRIQLAFAMDQWAAGLREANDPNWKRLDALARAADSDPIRNKLRDLSALTNVDRRAPLISLAKSMEGKNLEPRTALRIARMLGGVMALGEGIGPLRAAQLRHPDDFDVNFWLGFSSHRITPPDLDEAIRFYSIAIALRPDDTLVHNNLGQVLADKGLLDEAIVHFREAVRTAPSNQVAHSNLGRALTNAGMPDEAIECHQKALQLTPRNPDAHAALAYTYAKEGALDKAIKAYRKSIRLRSIDALLHKALGDCLAENNSLEEAIASYQWAIRLKSTYPEAHNGLGVALAKKGLLDQAIKHFKEAIRQKPDYFDSYLNLGRALAVEGHLDESLTNFRVAVRVTPSSADAHLLLGNACFKKGLVDEALASYRETIRLKPDSAEAQKNIGEALLQLGQLDEGLANYKQAIRLYRQRGGETEAKAGYNDAMELLQKGQAAAEVVSRFRAEAEELLREEPADDSKKPKNGA